MNRRRCDLAEMSEEKKREQSEEKCDQTTSEIKGENGSDPLLAIAVVSTYMKEIIRPSAVSC